MDAADTFLVIHRRSLLAVSGVLAAGVLIAWLVAKTTGLLPPMTDAARYAAYRTYQGPLRDLAVTIATLGDAAVAIVTVGALSAHAYLRSGPRAALLPFAAVAVVVLTTLAKSMPGRATTLPSGHTAYAVAVGGYAAWMLVVAGHPRRACVVFAVALLMAPARLIDGAHRPADVIAGIALGVAWALAVLVLGRAWIGRRPPVAA